MLELADSIGLVKSDDAEPTVREDWTPDQEPPAMARARKDDAPEFESFAATFGGPAAGGKGIVMNDAHTVIKPNHRGVHKDGTPRDAMESEEDCAAGFCSVCR